MKKVKLLNLFVLSIVCAVMFTGCASITKSNFASNFVGALSDAGSQVTLVRSPAQLPQNCDMLGSVESSASSTTQAENIIRNRAAAAGGNYVVVVENRKGGWALNTSMAYLYLTGEVYLCQ
jgi:tRNA uridine 5-carbamoylmethylation protein Kti12